ncbi:MAG: DNA-directed RNA polymerase subunit P [Candidatus Aenigmarchaeota archaeon]|nr:DNA-directed RNA polymerase subunit P [Candidatus Aenigmarchaeota archaeon]
MAEGEKAIKVDLAFYRCLNCGKDVKLDLRTAKKIICPFCGYRILRKTRSGIGSKRVLAR